jgi:hypothetical protein
MKKEVISYLISFGLLLFAVFSYMTSKYNIPKWIIVIIIIYFLLVIVMILSVLVDPFTKLLSKIREKSKKKHIAKIFYPQLHNEAKDFGSFVDSEKIDTIPYLLQNNIFNIIRSQSIFELFQFDRGHIATIQIWLDSTQKYLKLRRLKDFSKIAHDLSWLIHNYHYFCINMQYQLEKVLKNEKIQEEEKRKLKQEWNTLRERHSQFINNFQNLMKNINESLGEKICVDYFEPLKTLE